MSSQYADFLVSHRRFPIAAEIESLEVGKLGLKSQALGLQSADKQKLYIDVSHTYCYPYNSGIQRVVRSLVNAFKVHGTNFQMFKFESSTGQPVKLTAQEERQFYNWQDFIFSSEKSNSDQKVYSLVKPIKSVVPLFVWEFGKAVYYGSKNLISTINPFAHKKQKQEVSQFQFETLDLTGCQVLLPEVTSDILRVEMIEILAKHYQVRFSAIVYDLIPVTHPEYCTIGYDFIHYLRIFRYISHAICISKHTESELLGILKILDRRLPSELKTSSVYLPGEFMLPASAVERSDTATSEENIVLMVARFEPRKNIRRVAKAVRDLQISGKKFKFVLIGNPGWMQETIIEDLETYKKEGINLEYHLRLPDAELVKWYARARFTVFCSITEGFGLPIVESVLIGKPCITTKYGSQGEIAKLVGGCKFVDRFSVDEIKNAISELLCDAQSYSQLKTQIEHVKWPTWQQYGMQILKEIREVRT